jgi:TRAP-type C4-dicarboxylate transport system permease small subunit
MPSKLWRFNKVIEIISIWLNWIAVAGMGLMLLIITIDVVGAKAFRWPLPGVFDMVCLLEFLIVALAIPFTHILRGHVAIEFFVGRLEKRAQAIITTIAAALALILFLAMTWQMFSYSLTIQLSGEITPSLRIPVFPITYIATVSFCVMCLLLFGQFLMKINKELPKK